MQTHPERWLWLVPVSVSLFAGWLMLHSVAPEPALPASPPVPSATGGSAYPAPKVDPARPPEPPAPDF